MFALGSLWQTNMAIQNGHFLLIYQLNMVIFYSYVSLPEGYQPGPLLASRNDQPRDALDGSGSCKLKKWCFCYPSGYIQIAMEIPPFFMDKSTISMGHVQ